MLLLVMCLLLRLEMGSGGGRWCGTMEGEMREGISRERERERVRVVDVLEEFCLVA
jgi:hypothetical protein